MGNPKESQTVKQIAYKISLNQKSHGLPLLCNPQGHSAITSMCETQKHTHSINLQFPEEETDDLAMMQMYQSQRARLVSKSTLNPPTTKSKKLLTIPNYNPVLPSYVHCPRTNIALQSQFKPNQLHTEFNRVAR